MRTAGKGGIRQRTVYCDDPVATALKWQSAGAKRLHVVDLDGAREGSPKNHDVIRDIVSASTSRSIRRGIREKELVDKLLAFGVDRCILERAPRRTGSGRDDVQHFQGTVNTRHRREKRMVAIKGWWRPSA